MTFNNIYCGDAAQILKTVQTACVDLVVTDPPYLVNYQDRAGRRVLNDNNASGVLPVFDELYRVLKPDSLCITFCGWTALPGFSAAWENAGFRIIGHIVWCKPYASSARQTAYHHESAYVLAKGWPEKPETPFPDVQDWVYSGNRLHPTEKSVEIIAPLIRAFSKPGELVLDPFLGSGTTAVAAALNGRRYAGMELEQKYCDLVRRRLEGVARFHAQSADRAPGDQCVADGQPA